MWFFEFIVLIKYSWLFFWRGGAYANEYLRYAEGELKRIRESKSESPEEK